MKTGYKDKAASCAGKVKSVNDELSYVRDLAAMTVEIAREPRMSDILRRWRDVNSGRMPDRPLPGRPCHALGGPTRGRPHRRRPPCKFVMRR